MFYPTLGSGHIQALLTIRKSMDEDPAYLDHEDCPYDDVMKKDIRSLCAVKVIETEPQIIERIVEKEVKIKEAAAGGGKRGPKVRDVGKDVEKELLDLIEDLKALKLDSNDKDLKTSDRVAMIKVRAALIEKMTTLRQASSGIRRVGEFMSTVLSILDDMLNDDQRQLFMQRIEVFAKEE